MSDTIKTTPVWVVRVRDGVEHHDHRNGVCDIDTPETRWPDWGKCGKRVPLDYKWPRHRDPYATPSRTVERRNAIAEGLADWENEREDIP